MYYLRTSTDNRQSVNQISAGQDGLRHCKVCQEQETTQRQSEKPSSLLRENCLKSSLALCELFDKTDTGGDGTISIKEYIAMCDEYGIELTEEHLGVVKSISNENGEVRHSHNSKVIKLCQVRKNDFICHIKNTPGMFGLFEKTDPESETHWQNLAITAFK